VDPNYLQPYSKNHLRTNKHHISSTKGDTIRVLSLYLEYLGVHLLCKSYILLMFIWKIGIHNNKLSVTISYHCNKLPTFTISVLLYKIILLVVKNNNSSQDGLYTVMTESYVSKSFQDT